MVIEPSRGLYQAFSLPQSLKTTFTGRGSTYVLPKSLMFSLMASDRCLANRLPILRVDGSNTTFTGAPGALAGCKPSGVQVPTRV
ncbi:hypothetical protein D3C87_1671550 [compost metagenome]